MPAEPTAPARRLPATALEARLVPPPRARGLARWVVYQRERFPLLQHAPLIAAFSGGAVLFSAQLRAPASLPSPASLAVAFASCLLVFFQLRVADEFKDAAEDARHRPYRPVPRGLVRLGELRALALAAGVAQLVLALALSPRLVPLLALVWLWIGVMTKEFWLRDWLADRPLAVIATHMLVMPLVDLYATACDWLVAGAPVHAGLRWFLVASFCNGVVVEVGRKVRAPADEEPGVRTYTVAWGRHRALLLWLSVMLGAALCALLAARELGAHRAVTAALAPALLAAAVVAGRFAARPTSRGAATVQLASASWTLLVYAAVSLLPLVVAR